jgi:hypothetical protein
MELTSEYLIKGCICTSLGSFVNYVANYSAFQQTLASSNARYRKCHRLSAVNNSSTPETLCSGSLDRYMRKQISEPIHIALNSADSIISHVNTIKCTLPLSHALKASLDHAAFVLIHSLSSNMSSWNLASLAWLLFRDTPSIKCSVSNSVAIAYGAVSPRVSFPAYSSLHSLECSCRTVCSYLHSTSTYLQVSHPRGSHFKYRQNDLILNTPQSETRSFAK